jgi:flagellar L-ring protein precursor FlgH
MSLNGRIKEAGMRQLRWIVGVVGLCMVARLALAESLWPASGDSLYKDKKAFKIGDVLTVNIAESASASHRMDTQAKKSSSNGISFGSQRSALSPFQDFGITGKEAFQGGGKSTRAGDLTGRITVRVIDVLPNGNLVINGNRIITVNDERQVMEITGIVRPEDVTAENSVMSTLVADAQIKYTGKGAVSEKAKLGLISRLLSMLFAF